jgi:hypothetical protein
MQNLKLEDNMKVEDFISQIKIDKTIIYVFDKEKHSLIFLNDDDTFEGNFLFVKKQKKNGIDKIYFKNVNDNSKIYCIFGKDKAKKLLNFCDDDLVERYENLLLIDDDKKIDIEILKYSK